MYYYIVTLKKLVIVDDIAENEDGYFCFQLIIHLFSIDEV